MKCDDCENEAVWRTRCGRVRLCDACVQFLGRALGYRLELLLKIVGP